MITLDQLRSELGLTRAEWRELQYGAADCEMSTRDFVRLLLRVAISAGAPATLRQLESMRTFGGKGAR